MNRIDRYIARIFLVYFLAGLGVFVTLFVAVNFVSFAAQNSDASTLSLLKYYLYYTPTIVYQMIPVACLMATVFTLSSLNKANELIALFSVGMSLARISAPILVIVSLLSAMSFWLGDRALPKFEQRKSYVYYVEIKNKPSLYSTVSNDKIWYRSENILFNIQTLLPEKKMAHGLSMYYFDSAWNLVQLINAERVEMRDQSWKLSRGSVTLFAEESSFPLTQKFSTKVVQVDEELGNLQESSLVTERMSLSQLEKFIEKNKEAGLDTLKYEVEYHSKFGFAFAAFVMSMLGIPFSVGQQRSGGTFLNVGVCIGLTFGYWVLYSSSITLGKHGALAPAPAAWLPNICTLILALMLLVRLKK